MKADDIVQPREPITRPSDPSMSEEEWNAWANCAVEGCGWKSSCSFRSIYCHGHTLQKWKLDGWKIGHLAIGGNFTGRYRTVRSGPNYIVCEYEEPDLMEVPYRFIDTATSAGQYGSRNGALTEQ